MNNKNLKIFLFTIASLFSFNAFAAWSSPYEITEIMIYGENDYVVAYITGGNNLEPGCTASAWQVISNTDERRARFYAMLLAAQTSKQKVRFWYTPGAGCGIFNYHRATVLRITTN